MNIITAYIEAVCVVPGVTRAAALRELNEETGLNIRSAHLYEMEQGKRALPEAAHRYMAQVAAEHILHRITGEVGQLTDAQCVQLAEAFSPPARAER